MDTPAGYLHWGFILISIPNLALSPLDRSASTVYLITISMNGMSVIAALWDSEGLLRNAGTPLEIASVPDSAMAPEENARSTRRNVSPDSASVLCRRCSSAWVSSGIGESPPKYVR